MASNPPPSQQQNIPNIVDSIARVRTFNVTFPASGGPFASATTMLIGYARIGAMVTVFIPTINSAANAVAASTATAPSGSIPGHLRPPENLYLPCFYPFNGTGGTNTPGLLFYSVDGSMRLSISLDTSVKYGTTGNNGWNPFSFSYLAIG